MVENQLAEAVEKYRDVIKAWAKGTDPIKRAIAETALEAIGGETVLA